MKNYLILLSLLLLVGCSKPVVITEFKEVLIPVRVYIPRDERPKLDKQSISRYMLEVLEHCEKMELSIDINNEKVDRE